MIAEFKRRAHEHMQSALQDLVMNTGSGGAGSFEDYRYRVGISVGLSRAIEILNETYHELMNDEDETDV